MSGNGDGTRKAEYKHVGRDTDANREKRRDHAVELRKFKRGEQYTKHRKTGDDGDAMHTAPEQQDARMTVLIETIKTTMDGATMLSAVSECRRIFAQSAKPPVQQFIDSGVLPLTVNLLRTTDDPLMQMEVAWVLTNVCAGTTQQTDAAVKAGAVVELVRLLHCLHPDPRDQAIWALANIAGDGPAHRNEVLRAGAMEIFLHLVQSVESLAVKRVLTWAISNLCRFNSPAPPIEVVLMALPVLKCILETSQDYEMKQEACWAITHVTSQQTEYVRAFVHAGFVPVLFSMLGTPHPRLLSPVIRVLGNIVSCDADDLTDMVLGHGILRVLRALLRTSDSMLIQSVLCITANILAGSSVQRQQVIQSMILPDILYTVSDPNAAAKTLTEAGFVVANLLVADNATPEQRQLALDIGALPVILRVLDLDVQVVDASLRMRQLRALLVLFSVSTHVRDEFLAVFCRHGGPRILEMHVTNAHMPAALQAFADTILQTYLQAEKANVVGGGDQFDITQAQAGDMVWDI